MVVEFRYLLEFPRRSLEEADVAECETYLGCALPPDFRAFLIAYDGPVPVPAWIPVANAAGIQWLGPLADFKSVMYSSQRRHSGRDGVESCIRLSRGNAIESYTGASREGEKLPRHYVVIGSLMTQPSTLLISTAPDNYGNVFAWHVGIKRFKPDQLIRVAGSFTELLGLLTEPPAEVVATYRRMLEEKLSAQRAGTEQRLPESEYEGPEARRWLRSNRNPTPLAANHFASAEAARQFVDELYAGGARKVIVPGNSIQDADDDGPYADSLVVFLPADAKARAAVCQCCQRELDEAESFDVNDQNPIFLWWD
jgi:hypothetical protein